MSDVPGDPDLYAFYDGYFTGPHHPPRPWPEVDHLEANARLLALMGEPTDLL